MKDQYQIHPDFALHNRKRVSEIKSDTRFSTILPLSAGDPATVDN